MHVDYEANVIEGSNVVDAGITNANPGHTLVNGVQTVTGSGNLDDAANEGAVDGVVDYDILGNAVPGSGADISCFQANPGADPIQPIRDAVGPT